MSELSYGLEGQVIVVTGASRGIGYGCAQFLAQQGAKLVLTGRKPERLEAAVASLGIDASDVLAQTVNAADRDGSFALAAAALAKFGRIDGLVANAQTFRPVTPLEDVTPHDLDVVFNTGPAGTLWAMQSVLPAMKKRGRGRIVTMGSAVGLTGGPGYGPYSASNEAIRSLTRTAAREWGRYGVLVNCVCPASVGHRMPPSDADPARAEVYKAMYADHPLGRDGDLVTDIGAAVGFLLSDGCSYLTGQTLMVDGGGIMRA
jgi:NAD(P)-dependent dehydrogenase (short-subunit alcohol dehydrogenase family)